MDAETMELVVALWTARHDRQAQYERALARDAYYLGRSVSAHDVTMADARTRLGRWVRRKDRDTWFWNTAGQRVDVPVFASPIAHELGARAFARGYEEGKRRHGQ